MATAGLTTVIALLLLARGAPALTLRANLVSLGFGPAVGTKDALLQSFDVKALDVAVGVRLSPGFGLALGAMGADFYPLLTEGAGGIEYPALQGLAYGSIGADPAPDSPMWYCFARSSVPLRVGFATAHFGAGVSWTLGALNPGAEFGVRSFRADGHAGLVYSLQLRCGAGGWYDF